MPPALEAEVGLIHIAGAALRATPPPGTVARTAPRRSGRGRADDILFLDLSLRGAADGPTGLQQHLAQLGAEAFFKTPGSVTAALRESAAVVNDHLVDTNRQREGSGLEANWFAGVLRGTDFYVAHAGGGEAIHLREESVHRFSSQEAETRPLGISTSPRLRYHHLEVRAGDMLLLTSAPAPSFSEPVLKSVSGHEPAQAIELLGHARQEDMSGLLLRLVPEGQATAPLPEAATAAAPKREPRESAGQPRLAQAFQVLAPLGSWIGRGWGPVWTRMRALLVRMASAVTRLLVRMAPGLIEPPRPGEFSPALLAGTAVVIPLLVLTLVSVVYLRRGRNQQFQAYLREAQEAIATAQAAPDTAPAQEAWSTANYYLERALEYGDGPQRQAMATQVRSAMDELNLVSRMEFTPAVSGGFGGNARIEALAATSSDLYVLDLTTPKIWHAWATGRGYEIDSNFDCLDGPDSVQGMSTPVDLAVQSEPGALGAEGVVAVDADGTLLYCAPDRRSLSTQLASPGTGFGRIQAIDTFQDTLYILDARANAVWLYDATGGVFSGEAQLYFVEEVPNLSGAIDLAKSQDELFILYQDEGIDRCRRETPEGTSTRVTCVRDLTLQDSPPGEAPAAPARNISEIVYSPPPEPSLFFLDEEGATVYHFSMRMIYQSQIQPTDPFPADVSALTLGPPNDLFVAAGQHVYFTPLR